LVSFLGVNEVVISLNILGVEDNFVSERCCYF